MGVYVPSYRNVGLILGVMVKADSFLSASSSHCAAGSSRTEGIRASDVLPVLKEKVAFVSGECQSFQSGNHQYEVNLIP